LRLGRGAPDGATGEAFDGRLGRGAPDGATGDAFDGLLGRPAPERDPQTEHLFESAAIR
jgi:hypothetical protein